MDGAQQVVPLGGLPDVGLQEEGVHFRVHVFDGDLEAVKGAGFRGGHVRHEAEGQVFEDDAVGGGEEGEDVHDERFLVG